MTHQTSSSKSSRCQRSCSTPSPETLVLINIHNWFGSNWLGFFWQGARRLEQASQSAFRQCQDPTFRPLESCRNEALPPRAMRKSLTVSPFTLKYRAIVLYSVRLPRLHQAPRSCGTAGIQGQPDAARSWPRSCERLILAMVRGIRDVRSMARN
jgi:hypothetical protein